VIEFSVVIPLYNEAGNVARLVGELVESLPERDFEMVLVDDGSIDGTAAELATAAEREPRVRVVYLTRNFGQTAALAAGLAEARAETIVTMDGDLQNDPSDIPELLEKLDEGFDVVSGWRRERTGSFVARRLPSRIANWMISLIVGGRVHDNGCGLKAYRREFLEQLQLYGEGHRILLAQAVELGARIAEVEVADRARSYGASKYGISRTYKVLLDLLALKFLSSYAFKPIRVFGGIGFIFLTASFLLGAGLIVWRLLGEGFIIQTPLLLVAAVLFIVGVFLVLQGLLAELTVRLYHEVHGGPIYRTRVPVPRSAADRSGENQPDRDPSDGER
jgi:glycosyltransferase involved in cell wall biosynthesis